MGFGDPLTCPESAAKSQKIALTRTQESVSFWCSWSILVPRWCVGNLSVGPRGSFVQEPSPVLGKAQGYRVPGYGPGRIGRAEG